MNKKIMSMPYAGRVMFTRYTCHSGAGLFN